MSRYRQSFSEALAQVEKWSKDVEVKSTGEHAGKTIGQLKKEVDALRGKPNNEKEMGGLLFAIRAKQGWKKGEGSTGVEEATQIKHEKGEVKVDKAERGERKAGESDDDYEDRESGGEKGFRPDPNKKKKKQDDLDRDDEAQATRSKVRPTAESDKPEQGKVYALTGKSGDASIARGDSWKKSEVKKKPLKITPAGKKALKKGDHKLSITAKGRAAVEDVEKEALDTWHPDPAKDRKSTSMKHTAKAVAHHDAQKKKPTVDSRAMASKLQDILKKQKERQAAAKKESTLPPHLSKFLDKKGNPNPEAAKRMAAGKKKRAVATKVKDVTPKGYGPNEEVEVMEFIATYQAAKRQQELKKKQAAAGKVKNVAPKGSGPSEEVEDKFDYKPKKGAVAAPGSGSIAKAKKAKASDVNKSLEQQMAAARTEDIVKGIPVSKKMAGTTVPPKQAPASQRMDKSKKLMPAPGWKTRKAGSKAGDMTTEDLEFKVKIKGIPSFYVPAKTAAKVKQSLRKQLKHPDDIVSITRVTKAAQKIDFRLRAQGKGGDGGDEKE